jgi:tRNA 2-selenouridine synthase SelU
MPRKKYSINWENDEPVSFEVDAVLYESLDQIPDEADRSKLETMMNASVEDEFEKKFEEFDREFEKEFETHKKTSANAENSFLEYSAVLP